MRSLGVKISVLLLMVSMSTIKSIDVVEDLVFFKLGTYSKIL